ncbi:MAG: pyridoxal-phosphate dependent enzyme [Halobacteriaceae archaeon]
MQTTAAFTGLSCTDCGERQDAETTGRCPDCGAPLAPDYNLDAVDADAVAAGESAWDFDAVLPMPASAAVSIDEGDTPLVACPSVAEELGVESVLVKDEGRNPTGAFADRGASVAVSAAAAAGAESVALPSPGTTGQSVAAYAGRADVDSTVFVPTRAGFVRKAMINVHGGQMSVVEGRLNDAVRSYEKSEGDWAPARAFDSPYVVDGLKTMLYEVAAARDWTAPDAVIHPTGSGAGVVASHRAASELTKLGLLDGSPSLYAAQAEGCAPIVDAFESGEAVEPVEHPDTIAGDVEDPDPPGGEAAVAACRESGGAAVSVADPEILESAVRLTARAGVELSVAGGVAAAAAWDLADEGAFDGDETIVLVNPDDGSKDADVLRSHLMGRGV